MRELIRGIKNLIAWFPIIWNDWDYDHTALLCILQFKLKRMLPVIENGHYVGCEKDARRMKIAISLLDRQINDTLWYHDNAFMFHRKKYGKPKHFVDENRIYQTTYPDAENPEKADREAHRLIVSFWKHQNEDWYFLFDLLKKYLRNWWD